MEAYFDMFCTIECQVMPPKKHGFLDRELVPGLDQCAELSNASPVACCPPARSLKSGLQTNLKRRKVVEREQVASSRRIVCSNQDGCRLEDFLYIESFRKNCQA